METYVIGSPEFVKLIEKSCKKVTALKNLQDVWKLPQGAVLYTDLPLRTVIAIKMKAPWLTVRAGAAEVVGVKHVELSVYELLDDIMEWGTCDVYVPDDVVRHALKSISDEIIAPIRFEKTCRPTFRCPGSGPPPKKILDMLYELYAMLPYPVYNYYNYYREPDDVVIDRRYLFSPSPTPHIPIKLETEPTCTTIGTPYFGLLDWDYFLDYPLGLSAEELAAQLREGRLEFQKIMPELKALKCLCP
jgi:hypothetical protein